MREVVSELMNVLKVNEGKDGSEKLCGVPGRHFEE